jgi:hypothetical protein
LAELLRIGGEGPLGIDRARRSGGGKKRRS